MADYTPITNSELLPDNPITSLMGFRWRDNPIAIAEGAPGAPKVMGQALRTLLVQAATSQFIITDLDRVTTLLVGGILDRPNDGVRSLNVDRSTDGGQTWGDSFTVFQVTSGSAITAQMRAIYVETYNAVRFTFAGGNIYCFAIDGVAP